MDEYENEYLENELPQSRVQNIVDEEELLAAQAAAEAAAAQQLQQPGGAFNNVGQGLTGKYRDLMMQYWQETINSIEHDEHDFKNHQLPLARIKKVMKTDEDVRMISAEAPILFAKGCDVFITELTMRAWIHAEEHKRRTLQKSDIAAALTKSDMFDFLIDVVPREEEKPKKTYSTQATRSAYTPTAQQYKSIPTSQLPPRNDLDKSSMPPLQQPHQQPLDSSDQFQQQQQQNLLQQHLLQQQMMHQQHLIQQQQQEQQEEQQQQHQQQQNLHEQDDETPQQQQQQHQQQQQQQQQETQRKEGEIHNDEVIGGVKPKLEENDQIPNQPDNFSTFQNFPVEYEDFQ